MMSTGEETPSLSTFILCLPPELCCPTNFWLNIETEKNGRKGSLISECPGAQNGKDPTQFSLVPKLSTILSHSFGESLEGKTGGNESSLLLI